MCIQILKKRAQNKNIMTCNKTDETVRLTCSPLLQNLLHSTVYVMAAVPDIPVKIAITN